jgi:hypothetical protein
MFNAFVGKRPLKDLRRRLVFTDEFRSRNPLPENWHRNG